MAHYSYDAVGRRIRKEIGSRVTRYVWAGARLLGETTIEGSHVSKRDYLWDPDRPIPYAMRENGKIYYLHVGARCEVLCMTDATGSVVWRADYRAFGQARVRAGEVFQPWRLAGQYFDEETGLHYSLARYYDPALGRFLSVDPVMAEGGSRNPYLYCDGDPINSLDPNGTIGGLLSAVLIGAAVGAVIGAAVGAGVEMYRQRNQEHFEWGKIGKAALIGGAIGAIGGAVGGAIEVAAGVTMGVVGAGALAGGLSSAVEHCAEAAITDAEWSWPELGKSVVIGASIGAVTAGVGGLLAARAARKAARAAEQRAAREATESTTKRIRKPNTEIVEKVGPPSRVKTRRETEVPYHNPPEMHVVKPGQPLDVSKMDPTKTYLWSVNREGEMLVAPEAQAGFGVKESLPEGRLVKHRDLTPGEGGLSGGEARAGGEFKIIKDADENPSNLWEMNNNSSSTFRRTDEFMPDESSHQAAFDLLADSGTDTSKIIPVNSHGAKPQ